MDALGKFDLDPCAALEVNQKLGRFVLRGGATLPLSDVYRDEAQSYAVCDIHGKMRVTL